ncbi:peroxiredoxin [Pelagicoccus sp. SDUM812003]|uniref:peroxiredoxin n=1 Tax=Pelagicoccus sp. SDUM812003 TaxID=3041267 RepID=UPI00280EA46C|nr:peroxiredoxin [Pelagicoccus sp. SDUM812003]MDQ8203438.1 peroxiredoxin [Pelagicoccus sp. SDUM812003]
MDSAAALALAGGMFGKSTRLRIGDALPPLDGIVEVEGRGAVSLKEYLGSGLGFVFFFPRSDTPGCSAQACSLRDAYSELEDRGVKVLGVSGDKVVRQQRFKDKRKLPYPLFSDDEGKVAKAFGVPSFLGIVKRQAFLFREGELVWKDESASTRDQAEDVLKALESLG